MIKSFGSFILFYISYFPLFVILTVKNLNWILNSRFLKISFLVIAVSYILAYMILRFTIDSLKKGTPRSKDLKVKSLRNKNNEILNYLFIYILPFISISINEIYDVVSFLLLFSLIAYISIKNSILYINPILNIVFKYNIYSFQDSKGLEKIILTKKNELDFSRNEAVKLVDFHKNVYLDIN